MNIKIRELKDIAVLKEANVNVLSLIQLFKVKTNIVYVVDEFGNLKGIISKGDYRKMLSDEIPFEMNTRFKYIDYSDYINAEDLSAFFSNKRILELPVIQDNKLVCELYREDKIRSADTLNFEEIQPQMEEYKLLAGLGESICFWEVSERSLALYQMLSKEKDKKIYAIHNECKDLEVESYHQEQCDTFIFDTACKFDLIIDGIRYIDVESIYSECLAQCVCRHLEKHDVIYTYFEAPKYSKIHRDSKKQMFFGSLDEFAADSAEMGRVYGENHNKNLWLSREYKKVGVIMRGSVPVLCDCDGENYAVRDGMRITANAPAKHLNKIHVYGSCIARGFGVANDSTIESYLQKIINEQYPDRFLVVNHGLGGKVNDIWDFKKMMYSTYEKGDIAVHIGGNSWNSTFTDWKPRCFSCSDALNELEPDVQCFIDKVAHINHIGNNCISDYIYENLDKEGCFHAERKNGKVNPYRNDLVLLESQELSDYTESLKEYRVAGYKEKNIGAIVMNCNPFTNGHLYLIEQSRKQVDYLYIFVVEENKSYFSFEDRFELVKKNCAFMDNVFVLPSGKYIISAMTFPDYFVKNEIQEVEINPSLDIELFGEKIAPVLNIKTRFVGTEPFDKITLQYNEMLKELLTRYHIDLVEIERKCQDESAISASRVRRCLKNNEFESIKAMVPDVTFEYLKNRFQNQH